MLQYVELAGCHEIAVVLFTGPPTGRARGGLILGDGRFSGRGDCNFGGSRVFEIINEQLPDALGELVNRGLQFGERLRVGQLLLGCRDGLLGFDFFRRQRARSAGLAGLGCGCCRCGSGVCVCVCVFLHVIGFDRKFRPVIVVN